MISRRVFLITCFFGLIAACQQKGAVPAASAPPTGGGQVTPSQIRLYSAARKGYIMSDKVIKTPEEWRKQLTPEQYHVTREQGTEQAWKYTYSYRAIYQRLRRSPMPLPLVLAANLTYRRYAHNLHRFYNCDWMLEREHTTTVSSILRRGRQGLKSRTASLVGDTARRSPPLA